MYFFLYQEQSIMLSLPTTSAFNPVISYIYIKPAISVSKYLINGIEKIMEKHCISGRVRSTRRRKFSRHGSLVFRDVNWFDLVQTVYDLLGGVITSWWTLVFCKFLATMIVSMDDTLSWEGWPCQVGDNNWTFMNGCIFIFAYFISRG